jgi:translin
VAHAGFLHDAAKEYVEARTVAVLIAGGPVPGPDDLRVDPTAWMRGIAEAASELRRHLLDRLRDGDLARGEELLAVMDDVYDALVVIDFPDAITSGLRRTLDALRAVLERTRGDVTTTVLQTRLQRALDARSTAG